MLGELTGTDWQQILGISDERIPQALILRGTRNLRTQYDVYRRRFKNVLQVGSPNGLIEDVLIGEYAGFQLAYASVYGSAMAAEVTHLFGAMGTRFVLQTGCCGAWATGIQAGDLLIPTKAYCGEGAAQYYVGQTMVVVPTVDVVDLADLDDTTRRLSLYQGAIYTTAALFAERSDEIKKWSDAGWDAVDMETATTLAVARYFGMDSASILFVFDNPRQHADIVVNETEKDARRRLGNTAMIESAFRIVEQYLSQRSGDQGVG